MCQNELDRKNFQNGKGAEGSRQGYLQTFGDRMHSMDETS